MTPTIAKYVNIFGAGVCFAAGIFSFIHGNIIVGLICALAMVLNLMCVRWL